MFRAPILAAFFVLSALSLAGVASRQVQASVLASEAVVAAETSQAGCPYLSSEGDAATLPPGHPPVGGEAEVLPPGHPPVGRGAAPLVPPRFDRQQVIDL